MERLKRLSAVFLFGFSSGVPLLLTASTLQAWMVDEKIDLTTIGLFSLVGLPYTLKFLWSPVMDRIVPPFLGRRRGWIVAMQLGLAGVLAAMAFSSPTRHPLAIAALAVALSFVSASQDISVDAYTTESLSPSEYGLGSALYSNGYRIGMIVAGAGALVLADRLSWKLVYLAMAGVMALCTTFTLWADEPRVGVPPPRTLFEAVGAPFLDFFSRKGGVESLVFMTLYRIDYNLTIAMTMPFMMELGFSKTDIGLVTKGVGLAALIAGSLVGGALILKLGLRRALLLFGLAQVASGAAYLVLAHAGRAYGVMTAAIMLENFCGGMSDAALTAFLMSLCNKRFTATQMALLTSFEGLSRYVAGAPSGYLAKTLGWPRYFLLCCFAGVPAVLLLVMRFGAWRLPERETPVLTTA